MPTFGCPDHHKRSGVPNSVAAPLKKDIRAVSPSHLDGVIPREQVADLALLVAFDDGGECGSTDASNGAAAKDGG